MIAKRKKPSKAHPKMSHRSKEPCLSVTSTKGKLKVLQSHYQRLGSCSVDDAFDGNWKQEVDSEVNECHRCSVEHVLDREIEIARCVRKLKNNKTGGSDGLVGELLGQG